jgi:predicted ATP-dependent endonuclease of OLD family
MQAIMTPWVNEGFFADVAVLVEGEDDRAAILGAAVRRGIDLESKGVAVIPCGGKHSIDRPFLVFSGLGIPTYIVFDADTGKAGEDAKSSAKANRALQRLIGCGNVKDFPDTQVASNYAVFQTNLNAMVRDAVGEKIYESVALEFIERHGYPKTEQCRKSPAFICKVLEEADKANVRFVELEGIIDRVLAMVPPSATSTASVEPEAIAGPLA